MAAVHERITIQPGKRGGQPCVRGLRITVDDVLGWLSAGMTEREILDHHPTYRRRIFRTYTSSRLIRLVVRTAMDDHFFRRESNSQIEKALETALCQNAVRIFEMLRSNKSELSLQVHR